MTKMRSFFKNTIRRISKITASIIMLFTMQMTKSCFAVVEEVSGGGY